MSAMAQEENALNLSQGFPDFGIDNQLIEYLHEGEESSRYTDMPLYQKLS